MIVPDLDSKDKEYNELLKKNEELRKQQEELLLKTFNDSKPLIEWYREKEYIFTHPTIKYSSNRGPILGFDFGENELIVYDSEKGFRKVNINSRDERGTVVPRLISEGHFETAMDGFKYLETMVDEYLTDINTTNSKLEFQISKYL